MSYVSSPAAPASEPTAPDRSIALAVAGSVVALALVVVGFVLVALALVGVGGVGLPWGAGLCVGGWALAAAVRERSAGGAALGGRAEGAR